MKTIGAMIVWVVGPCWMKKDTPSLAPTQDGRCNWFDMLIVWYM